MTEAVWLKCKVAPGMFPNEVAVVVEDADKREMSLFANSNLVEFSKPLTASWSMVEGMVKVSLLERNEEFGLVSLPTPALEGPRSIKVERSALRQAVG